MGMVYAGAPNDLVLILKDALGAATFVETGTYRGDTAAWAASEFERVVTIEASSELYNEARSRYGHLPNVDFCLGDSREMLAHIVPELAGPAVFWLDGHFSGDGTAGAEDECPVLDELAAIRTSDHSHAVIIDDARMFLCAPPPPHEPSDWPSIDRIVDALRHDGDARRISVIEDVIVSVPIAAANALLTHERSVAARAWNACHPPNMQLPPQSALVKLKSRARHAANMSTRTLRRSRSDISGVPIVRRPLAEAALKRGTNRLGYSNPDLQSNGERNLVRHLALADGDVVFDVGANEGGWAAMLLAEAPKATLHCFEPSPPALQRLRDRVPNASFHEIALSDCDGEAILYSTEAGSSLASLYLRDLSQFGLTMDSRETVKTSTVDSFCAAQRIDEIELLKIDVEGAELDVIRGSAMMLPRTRVIQFEYGGTSLDAGIRLRDFYKVLEDRFDLFRLTDGGLLSLKHYREIDELPLYCNYVAVRRS